MKIASPFIISLFYVMNITTLCMDTSDKNKPFDKEKEIIRVMFVALEDDRFFKIKKTLEDHPHLINATNIWGETLLYKASFKGNTQVCSLLLGLKAEVNCCTHSSQKTPLHVAKNNQIVEKLLKAGARIHQKDISGETPLLSQLHHNTQSIPLLLQYGADINDTDQFGNNALHILLIKNSYLDTIPFLLQSGLDPALRNNAKQIPLELSHFPDRDQKYFHDYGYIAFGKSQLSRYNAYDLLKNNAKFLVEINNKYEYELEAKNALLTLFKAIYRWNKVQNEDLKNKHIIINNHSVLIIRYPTFQDIEEIFGQYSASYAQETLKKWLIGNALFKILKKKKTDTLTAIFAGDEQLPADDILFSYTTQECKTIFDWIVQYRYFKTTMQSWSCIKELERFLQTLINEGGLDIYRKNNKGETILSVAIQKRCTIEVITSLLQLGADCNIKDNDGCTL